MARPMSELSRASLRGEDGVAVITFDVPGEPVNTLSPELGAAFEAQLQRAEQDDAVKAVVFISGKQDNFIAGADDRHRSRPSTTRGGGRRRARSGQAGFDRLDDVRRSRSSPPSTARASAAASSWRSRADDRIATDSPKTELGLPEVQLGLHSRRRRHAAAARGSSACRRRSTSSSPASTVTRVEGEEARPRRRGRAGADPAARSPCSARSRWRRDAQVERRSALGSARREAGSPASRGPRRQGAWAELALEENPLGRKLLFDQARKQLLKKTARQLPGARAGARGGPRSGSSTGCEAGLEAEARAFGELVVTDVATRLMEIFFATTALKKDTGIDDPSVEAARGEEGRRARRRADGRRHRLRHRAHGRASRCASRTRTTPAVGPRAQASVQGLLDERREAALDDAGARPRRSWRWSPPRTDYSRLQDAPTW